MPVNCLTTESRYLTPERTGPPVAAWFPGAVFYAKAFGIVYRAAGWSKQGRYDHRRWIESSVATVRALESVGGRFEFQGLDVVRNLSSPCVFIGNHMSILETFVLPCLIVPHRNVTFVIKESLITYPLFGHVMRSLNPVVVGRENPREDLRVVWGKMTMEMSSSSRFCPSSSTHRKSSLGFSRPTTTGLRLRITWPNSG